MGIKWQVDVMEKGSGVATLNDGNELIAQQAFEDISKCGPWIKEVTSKVKSSKYEIKPIGRL